MLSLLAEDESKIADFIEFGLKSVLRLEESIFEVLEGFKKIEHLQYMGHPLKWLSCMGLPVLLTFKYIMYNNVNCII